MAKIKLKYEESRALKDRAAALIGRAVADTDFRRMVLSEPKATFRMMGIEISDKEAKKLKEKANELAEALKKADKALFESGKGLSVGGISIPDEVGQVAANCGCGGAGMETDIYQSEWMGPR